MSVPRTIWPGAHSRSIVRLEDHSGVSSSRIVTVPVERVILIRESVAAFASQTHLPPVCVVTLSMTIWKVSSASMAVSKLTFTESFAIVLLAAMIANFFLFSPFLSQKLFPLETANFTQCFAMWPEQACSTYCNSPTLFR